MTDDELSTKSETGSWVACRHSSFGILSSFNARPVRTIRVLSFVLGVTMALVPAQSRATDNLGILGSKPKWEVLEHYHETITRDEFVHLLNDVYCPHGFDPPLFKIEPNSAQILVRRDP